MTKINIKEIKENQIHLSSEEIKNQVAITLERDLDGVLEQKEIILEGKGSLKVLTHV